MNEMAWLLFKLMLCIIFISVGLTVLTVSLHFSIIFFNSFLVSWNDTKQYFQLKDKKETFLNQVKQLSSKIKLRRE